MPLSHTLVLNASEGLVQICIARQEEDGTPLLLCAQNWHAPSQGAELLAPALSDLLQRLHLSPADIDKIAVVRGPGSFTGLRLVLATAAGLARATGARCTGIEYMPLLARSAMILRDDRFLHNSSRVWVLTHARKQLIHMQGFLFCKDTAISNVAPRSYAPLGDIVVCSPEVASRLICEYEVKARDGVSFILGSGLDKNRQAIIDCLDTFQSDAQRSDAGSQGGFASQGLKTPGPVLLPSSYSHPTAEVLLLAAQEAEYHSEDIEPLYVRGADAEDNLERIALTLGLDPILAKSRFFELTHAAPIPE